MSRFTYSEMADELEKMVHAKQAWLHGFSEGRNKRPDFEIDAKWREMAVLQQAADSYRAAAEKAA